MEIIREQYEKTVDSILKTWTTNTLGGTELDWIETEWELIERNSEQYLDNVNAAYETQKLQTKYLELLENLANKTAFYRMRCNMEPEAAVISYQAMSGRVKE